MPVKARTARPCALGSHPCRVLRADRRHVTGRVRATGDRGCNGARHHSYFTNRLFQWKFTMSTLRLVPLAIALALAFGTASAQTAAGHAQHKAAQARSSVQSSPSTQAQAATGGTGHAMAAMDERMKAMHAMHEKMVNARTPQERDALMAEHMKTMQDGMGMMSRMGGMGGMEGGPGDTGRMEGNGGMATPGHMAEYRQMLEKPMDMQQSMMQMMTARMQAVPARQARLQP